MGRLVGPRGGRPLNDAVPDVLQVAHALPANTVAFRIERGLSEALSHTPETSSELSVEALSARIERCAALLERHGDARGAWVVRLSVVALLGTCDRWEEASTVFRAVDRRWPAGAPVASLERARAVLRRRAGEDPAVLSARLVRRGRTALRRRHRGG